MKNVAWLYGKYYNAYKNNYDTDGELNEAKRENFGRKQFEFLIFKEIKKRGKGVDKKGFIRYFNYEPIALVIEFQIKTHKILKKRLDKIKLQKIELNKDERNSTNNKNENDRLNLILRVIDRIYQFFQYKFLPDKQLNESILPKWVGLGKERFN